MKIRFAVRVDRSFVRLGRTVLLAAIAPVLALTAIQAQAATTYIDPEDGTLYNPRQYGGPQLNGTARPGYTCDLPNPGESSYTSTAPTGGYWIEISWGVHSTHNNSVSYSVNGATCQTVNQMTDSIGTEGSGGWSGFKALNRDGAAINLTNGVSQITSAASGEGSHTRGLWRTTSLTGTLINPTSFGHAFTCSSPGNGRYYFDNGNPGSKAFAIGSVLPPGVYKLEISWGVNERHSSDVTYSYNQTGAGGFENAVTALTGVNQQGMNDGRDFPNNPNFAFGTWSGFLDLGTFTVEAGSQIWLSGSGILTMGVIQATPAVVPSPR